MAPQTLRLALVVDRDADHRDLFTEILRDWNFRTISARRASEAFALAGSERFDVVIIDTTQFSGDHQALVQRMREEQSDLPVLAMSTSGAGRSWAAKIGAAAFLAKPFDLLDLQDLITRLCPIL